MQYGPMFFAPVDIHGCILFNSEVTKSHPKGDDDIKFSID